MDAIIRLFSGRSRPMRIAVFCAMAFGIAIQSAAQVPAARVTASPAAVRSDGETPAMLNAPVATTAQISDRSTVLDDEQMNAVVGSGFWSALWEGIKFASEVVLFMGLLYLVGEICTHPQVSCFET